MQKNLSTRRSWPDRLATLLSLQEVFCRGTEIHVRAAPDHVVSPCRGKVLHVARIGPDGRIPEKKKLGRQAYFHLQELTRREEAAEVFAGGDYVNLYLSPWDYHFLIFPVAGRVATSHFQDGFNWPVVVWDRALLRNAKWVTLIETAMGFPLGLVMVASWMVGGIEPLHDPGRQAERGDRFARFRIGSTVVLLFPPGRVEMLCREGQKLELGDSVARALHAAPHTHPSA